MKLNIFASDRIYRVDIRRRSSRKRKEIAINGAREGRGKNWIKSNSGVQWDVLFCNYDRRMIVVSFVS